MKIKYSIVLTFLGFCAIGWSQSITVQLIPKEISQYNISTWQIEIKDAFQNPYDQAEVSLDMVIQTPDNKQIKLPCYFEKNVNSGKSLWKARFAPELSGNYACFFEWNNFSKQKQVKTALQSFKVSSSSKKGFLHPQSDWNLVFSNGTPFRGLGENICWESRSYDDSKYFKKLHEDPRFNYKYMLNKLSNNGGNFARIWMCAWNFPLDNNKVINTNRYTDSKAYFNISAVGKMDSLFQLADSLGVYIMLTLDHAGTYIGEDWERNNYNIKNGGFARSAREFFTNEKSKNQYKNKLRYLIARYGCYSSIAAWEFFNEIDNLMFAGDTSKHISAQAVVAWHKEMSEYLKNTDPYQHLVTTSISHRDVEGLNDFKTIDFNQKHIYKYTKGIPAVIEEYTSKFKKPYVIGEYGYEWDWSKNFDEFALEMDSDFKRGLWLGVFSATPIMPLSWWWEYFENRGLMAYFKSVRKMMDTMMDQSKIKPFTKFNWSSPNEKMLMHTVGNEKVKFIYLFNQSNSINAFDLELPIKTNEKVEIEVYDCESGMFDGKLVPTFKDNRWQIQNLKLALLQDKILVIKSLN